MKRGKGKRFTVAIERSSWRASTVYDVYVSRKERKHRETSFPRVFFFATQTATIRRQFLPLPAADGGCRPPATYS